MKFIQNFGSLKKSLPALGTMVTLFAALLLTLPALASSQMTPATSPAQQGRSGSGFIYQGYLSESAGGNTKPAQGAYDFRFSLFEQQQGTGNQIGSTLDLPGVAVDQGVFSVPLDFGSEVFQGGERWLEISVRRSGGTEYRTLTPRQQILTVPYASWADGVSWERIVGKPDGIDGSVVYTAGTGITIAGQIISVDTDVIQNRITGECATGSSIRVVNANGTVVCQQNTGGGGETSFNIGPGLVLDGSTNTLSVSFAGSGSATNASRSDHDHAGAAWSTNAETGLSVSTSSVDGIAFLGHATADPPNIGNRFAIGTYGIGDAASGRGIEGFARNTSGANIGTAGFTGSPDGVGIFGRNQSEAAGNFVDSGVGVYGISDSENGSGVYGFAFDQIGESQGVWGTSVSPAGVGVRGSNEAGGVAGLFEGDVEVDGNLTKSSGSFKIDHPLDPTNKYLYHSFVESPDMMNIYNGNVVLDEAGEAWVQMPDWFEALNMEFRYQLTPIGAPGPNLYIAQEMSGNRFQIAGGTPGMKVSWQVTGIRNDAYARANRIPVEVEKPLAERGTYLHPEEFGQPDTRTRPTFSALSQSTSTITGTVPME